MDMWTIILLFCIGITLLFVEFLLPGAVLGILGFCCLVASVWMAWVNYPQYALLITLGEIAGLVLSIAFGMFMLSRSGRWNPLVMNDVQRNEAGYISPAADPGIVGKMAKAHTALRPAGTVTLNGTRINAVSSGTFIPRNADVKIIEVEGHRVVVESVEGSGTAEPDSNASGNLWDKK